MNVGVGLGVVVTAARGSSPSRRPSSKLSQVSCWARLHFANSSSHPRSCWNPRNWSGCSALKMVAMAPLGQATSARDG